MLKNISHNNQKKIALINDFTGFGRCSIAVELPIISTLKVQCCPLPTSIFSNHTGFDSYFFDDYTDRMERYVEEWKKLDLSFNGICSGFLGSARQISIVKDFIKEFKTDDTIVVVDPVMGDYGKIYSTYTDEMCGLMKELVAGADIITPNITESCILTGTPYSDMLYEKDIVELAEKLSMMGPEKVVITGIVQGTFISNYCYEREKEGKKGYFVKALKIGAQRSGTGDIFTSIIAADAVNGVDFHKSVKKLLRL